MSYEIDKVNEVSQVNLSCSTNKAKKKKRTKTLIVRNDTDRNIPQGVFIPGTPIETNLNSTNSDKNKCTTKAIKNVSEKDAGKTSGKTIISSSLSEVDPDTTTSSLAQAAIGGDSTALSQLNTLLADRNPAMVISAQKALNSVLSHKTQKT